MRMAKWVSWLVVGLVAASMLACGTAGERQDSARVSSPGTYVHEESGTIFSFAIPAPQGCELIEPVESYRRKASPESNPSYILLTVDNMGGTESQMVPGLSVITEEGVTVVFDRAFVLVGDWRDSTQSAALYNEGVRVYNSLLVNTVLPGARTTTLLASADPLESIARVFFQPHFDFSMLTTGGTMEAFQIYKE